MPEQTIPHRCSKNTALPVVARRQPVLIIAEPPIPLETQGAVIPRIVIADDHFAVRQGVRHILETQDGWEVVGEASNGQEAIQLNRQLGPDAIIMDITMPVKDGLQATSELIRENPHCKVLILTMHDGPSFRQFVQHSGAKGLLPKSRAAEELAPALKAIIEGNTYFH